MLDLRRALHAEPGSAEALRLASLRAEDVSAAMRATPASPQPAPATAPQHHTFDAVMQHHALRTHSTETGLMHTYQHVFALSQLICASFYL